ncbi:MarR family transcriptional regulator [Mycobacterium sp. CVI_P3]|uniref:MarR family transcriptional regulator n=1 Tax=Mycobacterium pinniadriaticum TaxID=2994102 RepID=A0ABT3S7R0_9MYCO|nr:MarR family transcriptional regulator [Mycobacterium pinniadriaticum]MCX2929118.1 MarR family transcriptional regulator [Mycobacterium pinniadriaticum]MCX2935543.1 MarR family transcriptional regulator [Mycobacterium pinniadriaticum]
MDVRTDLVAQLFSTVGRFRRTVRRAAGGSFVTSGLTESQAELLRLVGRQPGISVSAAAAELGLAANTASTLVSKLSAGGLLVRTPDPADRRVGRLELTAPAQQLADETRAARRAALSQVLDELDDDDAEALATGMRVLAEITAKLQEKRP